MGVVASSSNASAPKPDAASSDTAQNTRLAFDARGSPRRGREYSGCKASGRTGSEPRGPRLACGTGVGLKASILLPVTELDKSLARDRASLSRRARDRSCMKGYAARALKKELPIFGHHQQRRGSAATIADHNPV